jgi:hypothetical protein
MLGRFAGHEITEWTNIVCGPVVEHKSNFSLLNLFLTDSEKFGWT